VRALTVQLVEVPKQDPIRQLQGLAATYLEFASELENPVIGGAFATKEGNSLKSGMPGWRRSADRAGPHANSLLSGNSALEGVAMQIGKSRQRNALDVRQPPQPPRLGALSIVKPETMVKWHRAGFRSYWR
jgi:hypothetical protein